MKLLPADRFPELRSFYQFCYVGLFSAAFAITFVCWMFISSSPIGALFVICCIFGLYFAYRVRRRRQLRVQLERAMRSKATERPRMKAKLDGLRAKLRQFTADNSAELVMVPGSAIVLSTLRSDSNPIVEMSAGFWSTYSESPSMVEAAIAHEAGHIVARDVEIFKRLVSLMKVLASIAVAAVAWSPVALWLAPQTERSSVLYEAFFLSQTIVLLIGVALLWSALLIAREIQADAYAAQLLGNEEPIRDLLSRQLERRETQFQVPSPLRRLVTWLIQPNLRWRATLPGLRGNLGSRVELKVGIASACVLNTAITARGGWAGVETDPAQWIHYVAAFLDGILVIVFYFYFWLTYKFFWSRNRSLGGRQLRALGTSLGSCLKFAIPTYFLMQLDMASNYWFTVWTGNTDSLVTDMTHQFQGPETAGIFVTFYLNTWSIAKFSLLSSKERSRDQPSLIRAIALQIMTFIVIVVLLAFTIGLTSENEPLLRKYYNLLCGPTVFMFGVAAHFFIPRAVRCDPKRRNEEAATSPTESGAEFSQPAPALSFKGILRDVGILWVLSIASAATAGDPRRSYIALGIGSLIVPIIGFIIAGCLVRGPRWKHLFTVALVLWITNLVNLSVGMTITQWFFGLPFLLLLAAIGGGISYIIRR